MMTVVSLLAAAMLSPFNDGWEVRRAGESAWTRVAVPHDAAFDCGYDREEDPDQGFVRCPKTVYRKTFTRPGETGRYSVRFDGVYMNSSVTVNGSKVGGRVNGFLPFEVPLDGLAATNVIEVACDATTPNARWYVGCGILRNVWLVRRTGAFTLEPEAVAVTTELLSDGSARVRVKADGAQVVVPANGELVVRDPELWTPETPNLHFLDVTAENAKGERDTVRIRYGIRTVEFTKDRGLLLNGKPYRIKGLCRHETFGALGGALNLAATKRELAMCKEMGVNAIRTAHNPFSPQFYDLCDEMGFLVKDEAFDEWRLPKTKNGYSRFFDANWKTDLADFIRRDRNHPCVILWSVGNEIRDHWKGAEGGELTRQMVDVVHAIDRTRPVTSGLNHPDVSYTNGVLHALGVVGLNYNADWYAKLKGEKSVFGSETAPSLADRDAYLFEERDGALVPIQATNHLECAYSPKAFTWAAPAEVALKAQIDSPWSAGEFAWCTYDYLGEPNHTGYSKSDYWPARSSYWGLCDLAGLRKDRFYLYQSRWSEKPVVHLMPDWTLPGREGKTVPVWCYTNAEEAELFLNGVSQGVRRFSETTDLHLVWDVPYRPGTLEVRAKMRDGRIVTDFRRTAGPVAEYRVTRDFAADGLVFFRIDAVDANGTRVIACEDDVSVAVSNGRLLALDNGSPLDHTPFAVSRKRLCRGSLVAIVRGGEDAGLTVVAGGSDARLVVRMDYDTPASWERPRIGGETYRPLMWNEGYWPVGGKAFAGQEKRYASHDLTLFRDCAVTYTARQWPVRRIKSGKAPGSPGLSAAEIQTYAHFVTDPPAPKTLELRDFFGAVPAWEALEERARPDQPFFIAAHQARPAFFLEKTYATDREGFRAWQAAHPNFLGFEALGEFDSDAFFYCWKGKEQFPKMEPALQRHFSDGFAFPRDQYEWTNLVAEAWSRSSQLLFGRGDLFWPMCSGYFSLNHIFARFGAAGLMYEATGQGCPRWQVAGAFTRGAARQYGLPFVWYQAHFMTLYRRGDYAKTVGGNNRWNQKPDAFGGPWKGCSRELFVRQSLYGWLIGASFVGIEDWPNLLSAPDAKGVRTPTAFARELNALGELHRKVDRGVSYAPVALLVPFTDRYSCWGHTDGIVDDISQNSFYLTLVPVRDKLDQLGLRRRGDEGCLFNSPYGEIYDVLNADSGMPTDRLRASLAPYKCAFLVGTYRKGDLDVGALEDYVRSGGTLIVSADQVADGHVPAALSGVSFDGKASVPSGSSLCLRDGRVVHALENPYAWLKGVPDGARPVLRDERGAVAAYANAFGKGRVLTICASKMRPVPELDKGAVARGEKTYDLIAWLLKRVQDETMPVEVRGDVQWGVNRTAKGFLVWLFNNRGVTHYSGEEPIVDPAAATSVSVRAKVPAASVRDAMNGTPVDGKDGLFSILVPPGGSRLVELVREGPVR